MKPDLPLNLVFLMTIKEPGIYKTALIELSKIKDNNLFSSDMKKWQPSVIKISFPFWLVITHFS